MAEQEIVGQSNGHTWIKVRMLARTFVACRDCGWIRRVDDKNRPCPGVRVRPKLQKHDIAK